MSTFASRDTRSGAYARAMAGDPPLSEHQETMLADEVLEIFGEEELEEFLANVLDGVATSAGRSIRPPVARWLGGMLKGVAAAALPAGGPLVSLMDPGLGEVAGSKLGWMIDRALELELEGMARADAELERARRYVGVAATSARHAALAPPDAPPRSVVQSAFAQAVWEHVPDLLELGLAGALSPYKHLLHLDPPKLIPRPFTAAQKARIIEANKARCSLPGKAIVCSDDPQDPHKILTDPRTGWSVDHIVPMAAGGTNSYGNARVISHHLNSKLGLKGYRKYRKGSRPPVVKGSPATLIPPKLIIFPPTKKAVR